MNQAVSALKPERHRFQTNIMGAVRRRWMEVAEDLDIAFQPIIDVHSGRTFGVEALMRGFDRHGFGSPIDLINRCHDDKVLPKFEERLLERVFAAFTQLPEWRALKLFANIDGRTIITHDDVRGALIALKSRHGLPNANLGLEISERYDYADAPGGFDRLTDLRRALGALVLDDFGAGHANLQLFYHLEPGILKLDRFLISSVGSDPKKAVFLKHIVMIAHLLGATVIAEGVETPQEYYVCRDLGCDLVQGFLIARPTTAFGELMMNYTNVSIIKDAERRRFDTDAEMVMAQLDRIEPLKVDQNLEELFSRFGGDATHAFFPVVDQVGKPIGIVRERDLKQFAYSKYGRELVRNPRRTFNLARFVRPCASVNVNVSTEKILEIFSTHPGDEGVLMLQDSRYAGFLHAGALLQILNEKNLKLARDQNPLSRLPGNILIHEYVAAAIADAEAGYHFAYLDFDNFKPFNDKYGFRIGDRAIQMFAEILRAQFTRAACFIGHVGGDDFFVGFRNCESAAVLADLKAAFDKFRRDVESLYSEEDRANGYISGQSRSGRTKNFPLLAVSGAAIQKPRGARIKDIDALSILTAESKKEAKHSKTRLVEVRV